MQHLKSFDDLKKLYNFEDEDLSIKKSNDVEIVEEPFIQTKQFDPSKDQFTHRERDLTTTNSLGAAIQPMIQELQALLSDRANQAINFVKMKNRVLEVINNPNVSASPETRRKWTQATERCKDLTTLSMMMTNIVMGAAGMSKAAFDKKGLPF